jgi:hypothetical protein
MGCQKKGRVGGNVTMVDEEVDIPGCAAVSYHPVVTTNVGRLQNGQSRSSQSREQ